MAALSRVVVDWRARQARDERGSGLPGGTFAPAPLNPGQLGALKHHTHTIVNKRSVRQRPRKTPVNVIACEKIVKRRRMLVITQDLRQVKLAGYQRH